MHHHPHRPSFRRAQNVFHNPPVRAGLLARADMDFGDIDNVEAILFAQGVTLAPLDWEKAAPPPSAANRLTIVPTAEPGDLEAGRLAGIVVPGAETALATSEREPFNTLINICVTNQLPVMAFGDGVVEALTALGYDAPSVPPPGLLLHGGALILETPQDVREATSAFSPAVH